MTQSELIDLYAGRGQLQSGEFRAALISLLISQADPAKRRRMVKSKIREAWYSFRCATRSLHRGRSQQDDRCYLQQWRVWRQRARYYLDMLED